MDARRRARERRAEADDPHAEAQLLVDRVRAGEVERNQVLLLAYAGHPGLAAQLIEELAEWTAFNEVDAALDPLLGEPATASSLACWLHGYALLEPASAVRAMATAFPLVAARVRALEADPEVQHPYYAEEFEYEVESAGQALNAALIAFMNWTATGATPLLCAELRRSAGQTSWYGDAVPRGFSGLFEAPADCAEWTPLALEAGENRRRRRLQLEGWTSLLEAAGVDLPQALAAAQGAVQAHVRGALGL